MTRAERIAAMMVAGYPSRAAAWGVERADRALSEIAIAVLEETTAMRCADLLAQRPDFTAEHDRRRDTLRQLARELRAVIAEEAAK